MRITVNGTGHDWKGGTIDYVEVVRLANADLMATPRENLPVYSVTYFWDGPGDLIRQGTLHSKSPPIVTAENMRFSAYITSNA